VQANEQETVEANRLTNGGRTVTWLSMDHAEPGLIAALWTLNVIAIIANTMFFPMEEGETVSSVLFMSGTPVFAALLAGWVLGLRASASGLVASFLIIALVCEGMNAIVSLQGDDPALLGASVVLGIAMIVGALWSRKLPAGRIRHIAAFLLVIGANAVAFTFTQTDYFFWDMARQTRALIDPAQAAQSERDVEELPAIEADRLWEAQPALVEGAVRRFGAPRAGRSDIYVLAVAAGRQAQFSREAGAAIRAVTAHYGEGYRGAVLLSNSASDQLHVPLATRRNMASVLDAMGKRADEPDDMAFIYLVSHGSAGAELQTDLPNFDSLSAISASSLSEALGRAGIRRRVIVISACYAGSWIDALANDDTIVIAAARKDRTSFGCDDSRQLTYFGEAFLEGSLRNGASLRDSFDAARAKVARWEAKEGYVPSEPQVYVGRNMKAVWTAARDLGRNRSDPSGKANF
jgi:hypothetical protein